MADVHTKETRSYNKLFAVADERIKGKDTKPVRRSMTPMETPLSKGLQWRRNGGKKIFTCQYFINNK